MADAARFVGKLPLVAHNASFDRRYWQAELARADLPAPHPFACTVLLSRRLYPEAPSHKLGALVDRLQLPRTGRAHRALADAEMAASLLVRLEEELVARFRLGAVTHELLCEIQGMPARALSGCIARHAERVGA
jgi:DNA polymerase-3 subunit epsilon